MQKIRGLLEVTLILALLAFMLWIAFASTVAAQDYDMQEHLDRVLERQQSEYQHRQLLLQRDLEWYGRPIEPIYIPAQPMIVPACDNYGRCYR